MALHGDLSSIPLPELLQWLDGSRKTGTLQLRSNAGERKLYLQSGHVVALSLPGFNERAARLLESAQVADGGRVLACFAELHRTGDVERAFSGQLLSVRGIEDLARDELFGSVVDLTLDGGGEFHWTEDADRGDEDWAPADLGLRELLFESLRWLDEQAEVARALPHDALTVRAKVQPTLKQGIFQRLLLRSCVQPQHLGRLRLTLGMPRSAANRRIYELMRLKWVEVEGAPPLAADPVADMLEKGSVLVREGQFDAAALVCSSLLASDPADRRVRELARLVLLEHQAALYSELPPLAIPHLHSDPAALSLLKPEERQVAGLINGLWDVSTVVLASPLRELETLKALAKLTRLGLLRTTI